LLTNTEQTIRKICKVAGINQRLSPNETLQRNKQIIKCIKQGVPIKEIAATFDITRQTVWEVSRRIKAGPDRQDILQRNEQIIDAIGKGVSTEDIVFSFSLLPQTALENNWLYKEYHNQKTTQQTKSLKSSVLQTRKKM